MNRIIPRDPIRNIDESRLIESTLYDGEAFQPSFLERELSAYKQPVYYSDQLDLDKVKASNRGLLNSVRTSQSIFQTPIIKDQKELIQRYSRPVSGTASNYLLNKQNVNIGEYLLSRSQAVHSGRLY